MGKRLAIVRTFGCEMLIKKVPTQSNLRWCANPLSYHEGIGIRVRILGLRRFVTLMSWIVIFASQFPIPAFAGSEQELRTSARFRLGFLLILRAAHYFESEGSAHGASSHR